MKTSLILISITLLTLTSFFLFQQGNTEETFIQSTQTKPEYCPEPQYRSNEIHQKLMQALKNEGFSNKKVKIVQDIVPEDPRMFSKQQVLEVLNQVGFTNLKVQIMEFITPYITAFTTLEVIEMINEISFSSEKLEVLKVLAPTLEDATDENKELIVSQYGMSSDQNKAREILKNISSRDCIFGSVTENVATFIIDISGSMDYKFQTDDGISISRLTFVKQHLKQTIEEQLKDFQRFNVIALNSGYKAWQSDNISATKENIQLALKWIDSLSAGGATNLSAPLEQAFKSKQQLEAIYMLTDGSPNNGITSISQMQNFVQKQIDSRSPAVKIHCISFMLGGEETAQQRVDAQQFLETISKTSKGSFRQIQ